MERITCVDEFVRRQLDQRWRGEMQDRIVGAIARAYGCTTSFLGQAGFRSRTYDETPQRELEQQMRAEIGRTVEAIGSGEFVSEQAVRVLERRVDDMSRTPQEEYWGKFLESWRASDQDQIVKPGHMMIFPGIDARGKVTWYGPQVMGQLFPDGGPAIEAAPPEGLTPQEFSSELEKGLVSGRLLGAGFKFCPEASDTEKPGGRKVYRGPGTVTIQVVPATQVLETFGGERMLIAPDGQGGYIMGPPISLRLFSDAKKPDLARRTLYLLKELEKAGAEFTADSGPMAEVYSLIRK
jgi:hypothetical protein